MLSWLILQFYLCCSSITEKLHTSPKDERQVTDFSSQKADFSFFTRPTMIFTASQKERQLSHKLDILLNKVTCSKPLSCVTCTFWSLWITFPECKYIAAFNICVRSDKELTLWIIWIEMTDFTSLNIQEKGGDKTCKIPFGVLPL